MIRLLRSRYQIFKMTLQGFFTELQRLIFSFPRPPAKIYNSENCLYGDYIYNSKNLFFCFDCGSCTDSFYLYDSYMCADCGDCDYAVESELCYECVDPYKVFNCEYLEYCDNIRDSAYSYNCSNCHDIFGCVYLKNKSFCIFNRQLTEEEYREKLQRLKKLPPQQILQAVEQLKKLFPLTQTIGGNNENSTYGNYSHFNKNCYLCFDAAHDENCGYLYDSFYNKNCYDTTYAAQNNELSYEIVDCGQMFNCNFMVDSSSSTDSFYLFHCNNVKNSLGCVGLKNKEYCILNRQFTPEQYQQLRNRILQELKSKNLGWDNLEIR